mmetsp:Transcript_16779/g.42715  ORF Transcript_16779/g.42715 Transcript_16779/m.42715 type:complete len:294 (-) Transcript_16779:228-1109(-)
MRRHRVHLVDDLVGPTQQAHRAVLAAHGLQSEIHANRRRGLQLVVHLHSRQVHVQPLGGVRVAKHKIAAAPDSRKIGVGLVGPERSPQYIHVLRHRALLPENPPQHPHHRLVLQQLQPLRHMHHVVGLGRGPEGVPPGPPVPHSLRVPLLKRVCRRPHRGRHLLDLLRTQSAAYHGPPQFPQGGGSLLGGHESVLGVGHRTCGAAQIHGIGVEPLEGLRVPGRTMPRPRHHPLARTSLRHTRRLRYPLWVPPARKPHRFILVPRRYPAPSHTLPLSLTHVPAFQPRPRENWIR